MKHLTVERAEKIKSDCVLELSIVADARLGDWVREFTKRFPRLHGRILFGNGTELVEIGGRQVSHWDSHRSLKSLWVALDDVEEITDGYRLSVPSDLSW